jgi:hypothetical protein
MKEKLEIKRIRTKLKNISQIRIERWNKKQTKILQKDQEQKIKNQKNKNNIEKQIYNNLELNDENENK